MKILITIMMGIFLTTCVSAIYAGECMGVDLSELDHSKNILYIITGNSSDLNGMNITLNSSTNNASVCFAVNYKPDTFHLVFFNEVEGEKEVVVEHHYSSGGSSRTIYVQNKTIEYIDNKTIEYVDKYLDKIIYAGNETDMPKEDTKSSFNIFYLLLFLIVSVGLYFLIPKFIDYLDKGEGRELDKIKEDLSEEDNQ